MLIIESHGNNEARAANSMVQMQVTDVNGRMVLQSRLTSLVQAIDVSKLANGIYFATIKTKGSTKIQKILVHH
jgi:hypothetical protein